MATRLKILHAITGLGAGGAQSGLYELIRHLPDFEHHVVALKDIAPFGPRIRELGVPVHWLHMTDPLEVVRGSRTLLRLLRRLKPAWVHTWLYHADLFAGLLGRAAGIPVLWHLHVSDLDPRGVKLSTRWVAARCATLSPFVPRRIIACSHATARVHREMGYAPMEVIDNGVDVTRFRRDHTDRREALGLDEKAFVVGMVARFDPQKDLKTFLHAAALVRARLPEARFVLAGAGMTQENDTLNHWVHEHGLEEAVIRVGFRSDVETLYNAFDVFSLSSISEASSMSLLEAMACEAVPVVTDAGDSRRVLGPCGVVVPRRSPRALANGWLQIAQESSEARLRRGEAARARVVEGFSAELQARRFAAIYAG